MKIMTIAAVWAILADLGWLQPALAFAQKERLALAPLVPPGTRPCPRAWAQPRASAQRPNQLEFLGHR